VGRRVASQCISEARTVRGSGPDGQQPGSRSGAFTARSPDGPSSGPDGPRWRMVVFFSSYALDLVPWGRDLRVLWKGNVPLGHFYNVLVIKCPTHIK
jgi:hypothetical protein